MTVHLHNESEKIRIKRGVRHGDIISLKLFMATLESIFRRLNWENKGVKIDGEFLSNLRFADDIFLCTETPQELQQMLRELSDESGRMCRKMNIAKTKVMVVDNIPINVNNVLIENVQGYHSTCSWDNTSASRKKEPGQRDTAKNHGRLGDIRQNSGISSKANLAISNLRPHRPKWKEVCSTSQGGQGRAGEGRAGQGRAGQGRAGQGRAGQGRAGQGRAGQGRAGQGRAGEGRGGEGEGRGGEGRGGEGRGGGGEGRGNRPSNAHQSTLHIWVILLRPGRYCDMEVEHLVKHFIFSLLQMKYKH